MKTAIEWYNEEHFNLLIKLHNEVINIHEYTLKHYDILQQAKEMEKEQIINACKQCSYSYEEAEQYYNETFKSEQNENSSRMVG